MDMNGVLKLIQYELKQKSWVSKAVPVKNAAMEVLRIDCNKEKGGIKVDITGEDPRHKGLECVKYVKQCVSNYPPLGPLLLVFKYMLKLCNYNDPYCVKLYR